MIINTHRVYLSFSEGGNRLLYFVQNVAILGETFGIQLENFSILAESPHPGEKWP